MNGVIIWTPGTTLDQIEKQVIIKALEHYRGNKTATAGALGIAIRTLDNKFERYEAEKKTEEAAVARDRKIRDAQLARARGITTSQSAAFPDSAEDEEAGDSASAGIRVEPTSDFATQPAVSLPQRGEVQGVLSAKVAQGGSRGRR